MDVQQLSGILDSREVVPLLTALQPLADFPYFESIQSNPSPKKVVLTEVLTIAENIIKQVEANGSAPQLGTVDGLSSVYLATTELMTNVLSSALESESCTRASIAPLLPYLALVYYTLRLLPDDHKYRGIHTD